ncbi:hypothetical protein RB595_008148 [Gaeumannomyces hyphopodioides]
MATAISPHPTSQTINALLVKLGDADPDFRFMSLNDILTVLDIGKPDILHNDYNVAARTVDHLVRALDDQNGEVQNLAIKCLGPLVVKLPAQAIGPLIEKLSTMKPKNSVDNTVPSLAIRAVIAALPRPTPGVTSGFEKSVVDAYNPISRVLIPRLLGKSTQTSKAPAANIRLPPFGEGLLDPNAMNPEAVDVLIELVHCFGPMLASYEVEALHEGVVTLLDNDVPSFTVKKRAVVAISILAVYAPDTVLDSFVQRAVSILGSQEAAKTTRRLYITILGSMARSIPHRFGRHLPVVAPFILSTLGEDELQEHLELVGEGTDVGTEFNDIREASLVALESFLAACPVEMRSFTEDCINCTLRYIKYDPNYASNGDDDDEMDDEDDEDDGMDGLEDDDEFDTDYGFEDDDDASWKVRRCAAKVIYTLIATRSNGDLLDNGVLYKAAASLVKRFDEREENVRLEVISALALLVRKTGEGHIPEFSLNSSQNDYISQLPMSRKRRRQSSGGGATAIAISAGSAALSGTGLTSPVLEKVPVSGPRADLAKLTPVIVKSGTKLLKGRLLSTKQAVINLFDDIIKVQSGGLSGYLDQIMGPIIEAVKPSTPSGTSAGLLTTGGNASATPVTLRVAALRLVSDIAKTHSSQLLQPYLTKIVTCVVAVVKDRFYKISAEAIQTAEEIVKAITPPRSLKTAGKFKGELRKLYDIIVDRMIANDADTEVRQKAIHALGTLLSRTSAEGADLLPISERAVALRYLLERLKNETTRLSAVRAIDGVAASASKDVQFEPEWTQEVVVELSSQLRKSNRALRGSSVQALSHLTHSESARAHLGDETITALVSHLQPVITNNDAHLLSPALHILADLVQKNPQLVITPQTITAICELIQSTIAASVLDPLLSLVTSVGQSGVGGPLMAGILKDVGIGGDPVVVGKVIGNLLVASGDSAGVTLDSFVSEVQTSSEDQARASLALAVLGEAGLRLGARSPLTPDIFLKQFGKDFDKVSISAAVALGRAGAGDVAQYLPVILGDIEGNGPQRYLLLQSVKEFLQQVSVSQTDIGSYLPEIWNHLLGASNVEDNKAVCAECIGRLAIIAPQEYVPKLQSLLQDWSSDRRAIAVQSLRYTLPESGDVFDAIIKEHLVDMLVLVLQDKELEIRRLSMTALNSAAHNKPDLILAQLGQLLPYVINESVKNNDLIREVQMGPFRHTVDDGLEVRKSAYETLYALMETAFPRLDIIQLYDRIIDGLSDDNDIRALCNLMVSKLVFLAPEETTRRLDSIAAAFRHTMATKLKDNAVKQEIEKQNEANKSVLRVSLLLGEKLPASLASVSGVGAPGTPGVVSSAWNVYWESLNKDHKAVLKELREENLTFKEMGGQASLI